MPWSRSANCESIILIVIIVRHDRYDEAYQREVEIALFAGSLASSMASISAGGHVQPPPPSPPGHDPRTSSIQALRMRAKEHVESITKGLQMVWRLTEDTPRARTAASRIDFTLVTAWRASEQSFAQRRSRSRGVAWAARTVYAYVDQQGFVSWQKGGQKKKITDGAGRDESTRS